MACCSCGVIRSCWDICVRGTICWCIAMALLLSHAFSLSFQIISSLHATDPLERYLAAVELDARASCLDGNPFIKEEHQRSLRRLLAITARHVTRGQREPSSLGRLEDNPRSLEHPVLADQASVTCKQELLAARLPGVGGDHPEPRRASAARLDPSRPRHLRRGDPPQPDLDGSRGRRRWWGGSSAVRIIVTLVIRQRCVW